MQAGPQGAGVGVDSAVVLGAVHVVEVDPPGGGRSPRRDAVVDLVTSHALAHGVPAPLTCDFVGHEGGLDVEPAQGVHHAPPRLDAVDNAAAEDLVAAAHAQHQRPAGGDG